MQLTEEKRKALIEWSRKYLLDAFRTVETHPNSEAAKANLALRKIALASLTAEPVAYTSQANLDAVSEAKPKNLEFMTGDKRIYQCPVRLYTTPPAPALRLPDDLKYDDAPCHLSAYEADCWLNGASWMRREVERLNATAPQPVKLPGYVDDLHGVGPVMSAEAVEEAIRADGYQVEG